MPVPGFTLDPERLPASQKDTKRKMVSPVLRTHRIYSNSLRVCPAAKLTAITVFSPPRTFLYMTGSS